MWKPERGFGLAYQVKLWQYIRGPGHFGSGVLDRVRARRDLEPPRISRTVPKVKDEGWFRDAMGRLEGVDT